MAVIDDKKSQTQNDAAKEMAIALAKLPRHKETFGFILQPGTIKFEEMATREQELRSAINIWRNEIGSYVRDPETQKFLGVNKAGIFPINELPSWLEAQAALYNEDPARHFTFKGEKIRDADERLKRTRHPKMDIVEQLGELYEDAATNETFDHVDAMLRLVGNVVIRVFNDVENDELVNHVYESPRVRVVENQNNPKRPFATVLVGQVIETDKAGASERIDVAEVWTDEERCDIFNGKITLNEPISTSRPPLVHCFNTLPAETYHVPTDGPALADIAMRLINDGWSDLNYTSKMQGFGVAMIFNADPEQELKLSPGSAIKFSGDADTGQQGIEFAQPNAPLSERLDILLAFIEKVREVYKIPKSQLDVTQAASGEAMIQANGPLAEVRKGRAKLWKRIEREYLRVVLAVRFPKEDPDDWNVSVDYVKPEAAAGVAQRIQLEKHQLETGVVTSAELLMREHPDRFDSVEQAQEVLSEESNAVAADTNATDPIDNEDNINDSEDPNKDV